MSNRKRPRPDKRAGYRRRPALRLRWPALPYYHVAQLRLTGAGSEKSGDLSQVALTSEPERL